MTIFPAISQRCEVEYESRPILGAIPIEPYATLRTTNGLLPPDGARVWSFHVTQNRWRWAIVEARLADIDDPLIGRIHQFRARLIWDEVDAAELKKGTT